MLMFSLNENSWFLTRFKAKVFESMLDLGIEIQVERC
jgi:hypothetical protein